MVELSNERVEAILKEETSKTTELATILRAIYIRYMRMYERYFDDMESLTEEAVTEMKKYHEETVSLVKYYYMDIPQDVCTELKEFDEKYYDTLFGPEWDRKLREGFRAFRNEHWDMSEKWVKEQFKKKALDTFYEDMGSVFRPGFKTDSKAAEGVINGISELLFGKGKKED